MKRVLIVEDNPANMKLTIQLLQEDYEILTAVDGDQAVEKALSEHPDLILMDLSLPGKDGFQAVAEIREHAEFQATPVVAVTAHAVRGYREVVLNAGFDGYVAKPIDEDYLLQTIERLLGEPNGR
jgi:CheY-like chemotaxis protein